MHKPCRVTEMCMWSIQHTGHIEAQTSQTHGAVFRAPSATSQHRTRAILAIRFPGCSLSHGHLSIALIVQSVGDGRFEDQKQNGRPGNDRPDRFRVKAGGCGLEL